MARDVFGDEQSTSRPNAPVPPPASVATGAGAPSAGAPPAGAGAAAWAPPSVLAPSTVPLGGGPVGPPMPWLTAAAGAVIVSLLLGLAAAGRPALAVAGWLVGGFLSVGLVAAFTVADGRRRADSWYSTTATPSLLRTAVLLLAIAVVALNAWRFADWASRR